MSRNLRSPLTVVGVAGVAVAMLAAPMAYAHYNDGDRTSALKKQVIGGHAKNVILLIGDGMGDSEITSARYYSQGAAGHLSMDSLPMTGEYTTWSVQKANPSLPDYVPDSAATGTAWATGHKSYDGAISVLPDGTPKPTLLELAKKSGYRTGNVTTSELEDATPAVQAAHVVDRGCKGPQSMTACPTNALENGGKGSIAEQIVKTGADVTLGGGKQYFDQLIQAGPDAGKSVWQQAADKGYQLVTDASGLASADGSKPLLGSFAKNDLDLEWTGPAAAPDNTAPSPCATNVARNAGQPHLSDMASKAIQLLSAKPKHAKAPGFFLQIEGASIDKQDHASNACGQIGETVEFDKAVQVALDFQKKNPDTLVVVTADHGHTSQIVEAGSKTTGSTVTLRTVDGAPMTLSYATAPAGASQQHTGTEVRIAAKGPQAANVLGITDQSDLFDTISRALDF